MVLLCYPGIKFLFEYTSSLNKDDSLTVKPNKLVKLTLTNEEVQALYKENNSLYPAL